MTDRKRLTHEIEGLGKLTTYRWGRGYYVCPVKGGKRHAKEHGMGVADTLAQGREYLAALATLDVAP